MAITVSNKPSRWGEPSKHILTELEAFDVMRKFLEAYWRRSLCASDDLAVLLGSLSRDGWADRGPMDPAQWSDWLEAVEAIKANPN